MTPTLRKWYAIFSVYFQDGIAYRASGIIWILTDLVTAVTMPLVWASASKGGTIQGFTTSNFVLYYLCMLLLGSFITSHIMWDLAMEIKEGQFSSMLVRPVSFYQLTFLRNLSWRVIRTLLFFPFFIVLLWLYRGYLGGAHVYLGLPFWISLILGNLVSFTTVMMMSMIALFTQEAMSIFELYYVPMLFLSGQLFPVAVLPNWARLLGELFPFYYTTGAPTEIMIGRVSGLAAWQTVGAQVVWVFIAYAVSKLLWAKGLKYYTGVGM
ncbi:MAG TPA: ABC-2 family transporter protein [Fimbriimonadaceae bacterium]|nr:ABC-2 family transporter protein [Fimbriimonadaceae bacterium]